MNSRKNITAYGRFKGAPWFDQILQTRIFIGGAGGIGSHLAFQLARTGAEIVIVDNDTVGEENLAGQLYGNSDIGKSKVDAIADVIERLCGEKNVTPVNQKVDLDQSIWKNLVTYSDIVCVGFDNLAARRIVYEQWRKHGKELSFFVDGRMTMESGQVFVLDSRSSSRQFENYEATYFSEKERTELPCTLKSTTHCGALIASLMTTQITNWLSNLNHEEIAREVKNIEFHLPIMLLEQSTFKSK